MGDDCILNVEAQKRLNSFKRLYNEERFPVFEAGFINGLASACNEPENNKPCEYCYGQRDLISSPKGNIWIDAENKKLDGYYSSDFEIKINNCPMCGRKL